MARAFIEVLFIILVIIPALFFPNYYSFAEQGDDCSNPIPIELNEKIYAETDDTYSWWWFSATPSTNGKIKARLWNTSDGVMSWRLYIGCCQGFCMKESGSIAPKHDDSSEYYIINSGETVCLRIDGNNGHQDFETCFYFTETTTSSPPVANGPDAP